VVVFDRQQRTDFDVFYMFTPQGRVTGVAFLAMLKKLAALCRRRQPGLSHLLLCDVLDSHSDLAALLAWTDAGHRNLRLAVSSTAFLQPLDQEPFGGFKAKLAQLLLERNPVGGLVPFVVAAMQQSFSPTVIRAAFQKTGLVPYNRAILLNRASRFTKVISVPEQNKAGILAVELVFQRTAAAKPRGTVVHLAAPVELHELLLDEDVITLQQRRLDDEAEKAARAAARKVAQAAAKEEKLKARADRDRAKEERAKARPYAP
jgi:hypothetical protein